MTHSNPMSEFFAQRVCCGKQDCLVSVLNALCANFGISNATYFGSRIPGSEFGEDTLITTYHDTWVERYFDKDYKFIDPILKEGARSLLPLNWSSIPIGNSSQKTFFGEAAEFGVGKSGLTVPIRGVYGEIALFSVNSDFEAREWRNYCSEILPDLIYLGHLFHEKVLSNQFRDTTNIPMELTNREGDVLRWAANGKTAWETAQILSLTEKTVSFYLSNASVKLGVANKTQAVAKVISERLLLI